MIIKKSDVVVACDTTLKKFATSPDPAVADVQKSSKVAIIPQNAIDTAVYTVTFSVPFLMLVADPEPFTRTLSNILSTILGSSLSVSALINQIGKIETDLEEIAKHLKTKSDTGNLAFFIPITTKNACNYTVSARFVGKVLIDDDSTEDKAGVNAYAQWDGAPAPTAKPIEFPGECNTDLSTISAAAGGKGTGYDTASVFLSASVTTDGGIINTEFSSVYVEEVIVTIIETCPSTTVPVKDGPRPTPEAPRPPAKKRGRKVAKRVG
ncbi:MAG TPA: hypothetical protein VN706_21765 [Gemmatimonadaceae bacterium]|nr:hypothetical protein [Gemmatimonadaceae bacterium]